MSSLPPISPPEYGDKAPKKDEQIFPGGPYKSVLEAWKKQYVEVYMTNVGMDVYIWRPLNRYEYKYIVVKPDTSELMREEMICQQCVLWPENYDINVMVNDKAGIPSLLSEHIMKASGFIPESEPRLL